MVDEPDPPLPPDVLLHAAAASNVPAAATPTAAAYAPGLRLVILICAPPELARADGLLAGWLILIAARKPFRAGWRCRPRSAGSFLRTGLGFRRNRPPRNH